MTPQRATREASGSEPITDAPILGDPRDGSALVVEYLSKRFGDCVAFDEGWGIWVGIAVSARSKDVRAAQQLSALGSLPLLAVLALLSVLLAIDLLAWRGGAAMFDRERLITGRSA